MKKILLIQIAILFCLQNLYSQNIKPEEARLVAQNAYAERLNAANLKTNFTLSETYFAYPSETNKAFYIFEPTDRAGYIIVSAEKSMHPLLAYSFESFFNENSTPPAFWFLLDEYAAQIEHIRSNKTLASDEIISEWNHYLNSDFNKTLLNITNVAPLLKTKWNQDCFYNELCPQDAFGPCGYVYAGCVATAMGQVMKHHNWPLQGTGSFIYYHPNYGNQNVNFANQTYNWDIMPNQLSGSNLEVAKLLYHCGISVRMNYSPNGSGAQGEAAAFALKSYFKYTNHINHIQKSGFDNSGWGDMLKVDILANRPIYYVGFSTSGGHAFVCDGFQNTNFHFDFGWGGSANGYFNLNQVGGFNTGQAATFNVEPHYNGPQYCNSFTTINQPSGTISDGSGTNTRYANLSSCQWLIQVPDAEAIVLDFTYLNTEYGLDRVIVFEGTSENGRKIADISGYSLPQTPIVAGGNSMFIWFVSDEMNSSYGWEANYTSWMTNVNDSKNEKITISPIPADFTINVELPNSFKLNSSYTIYNINGQKIKQGNINQNSNSFSIDVSSIAQGIYNVEFVNSDGFSLSEKIVIKRSNYSL